MVDCSGIEVGDKVKISDGEVLSVVYVGNSEFVIEDKDGVIFLIDKTYGTSSEGLDGYDVIEIIKGNG